MCISHLSSWEFNVTYIGYLPNQPFRQWLNQGLISICNILSVSASVVRYITLSDPLCPDVFIIKPFSPTLIWCASIHEKQKFVLKYKIIAQNQLWCTT